MQDEKKDPEEENKAVVTICGHCRGAGEFAGVECEVCGGSGETEKRETEKAATGDLIECGTTIR